MAWCEFYSHFACPRREHRGYPPVSYMGVKRDVVFWFCEIWNSGNFQKKFAENFSETFGNILPIP